MDGVCSPSECSRNSREFLNPQSRRFFCCRCCGGRVAHGRRPSFVSCSRSPWRGRLPPGEQPAGTGSGNVCVCASALRGARTDLSLTSWSMTISEGRGHQTLRRVGLTQLCPRLPGQVARLPGARALPEPFSRGPVGCSPWCGSSAAELLWGSREAAPRSARRSSVGLWASRPLCRTPPGALPPPGALSSVSCRAAERLAHWCFQQCKATHSDPRPRGRLCLQHPNSWKFFFFFFFLALGES